MLEHKRDYPEEHNINANRVFIETCVRVCQEKEKVTEEVIKFGPIRGGRFQTAFLEELKQPVWDEKTEEKSESLYADLKGNERVPIYFELKSDGRSRSAQLDAFLSSTNPLYPLFCKQLGSLFEGLKSLFNGEPEEKSICQHVDRFVERYQSEQYSDLRTDLFSDGKKYLEKLWRSLKKNKEKKVEKERFQAQLHEVAQLFEEVQDSCAGGVISRIQLAQQMSDSTSLKAQVRKWFSCAVKTIAMKHAIWLQKLDDIHEGDQIHCVDRFMQEVLGVSDPQIGAVRELFAVDRDLFLSEVDFRVNAASLIKFLHESLKSEIKEILGDGQYPKIGSEEEQRDLSKLLTSSLECYAIEKHISDLFFHDGSSLSYAEDFDITLFRVLIEALHREGVIEINISDLKEEANCQDHKDSKSRQGNTHQEKPEIVKWQVRLEQLCQMEKCGLEANRLQKFKGKQFDLLRHHARCWHIISRGQEDQRRWIEAAELLNKAIRSLEAIPEMDRTTQDKENLREYKRNLSLRWHYIGCEYVGTDPKKAAQLIEKAMHILATTPKADLTLKDKKYFFLYWGSLGCIQSKQNKEKEAVASFETAIQWFETIPETDRSSKDKEKLVRIWYDLGVIQIKQNEEKKNWNKAAEPFKKAIQWFETIPETDQTSEGKEIFAWSLEECGWIESKQNEEGKAMESFKKALRLFETIPEENRTSENRNNLARLWYSLGCIQVMQKKKDNEKNKTTESFKKAIQLLETIPEKDLTSHDKRNLAKCWSHLNTLESEQKKWNNAATSLENALQLLEAVPETDRTFEDKRDIRRYRRDLARRWNGFGRLQSAQKKWNSAATLFKKAIKIFESIPESEYIPEDKNLLKEARGGLNYAKCHEDFPEIALTWYRKFRSHKESSYCDRCAHSIFVELLRDIYLGEWWFTSRSYRKEVNLFLKENPSQKTPHASVSELIGILFKIIQSNHHGDPFSQHLPKPGSMLYEICAFCLSYDPTIKNPMEMMQSLLNGSYQPRGSLLGKTQSSSSSLADPSGLFNVPAFSCAGVPQLGLFRQLSVAESKEETKSSPSQQVAQS